MKIARYIGDLLYDYECVVIPGLGGFLANDKPAAIQPNTHHFRPPYKQIMFNAYLKANDGLLVNYIASEENIPYKEAKKQVDDFVNLCIHALNSGKHVDFDKVGTLHLNENKKIIFEQDSSVNYNADAFGLTGFVSPAIRRANTEEKLREAIGAKVSVKKEEAKKQNRKVVPVAATTRKEHKKLSGSRFRFSYRTQLVFLAAFVLAIMVGWGFMNKDKVNTYYNNYSSVIPLFYSQPNAFLISNIDKVPISKVSKSRFGSWWISLFEKSEAVASKSVTKKTSRAVAVKVITPRPAAKSATPAVHKPEKGTPVNAKVAHPLAKKVTSPAVTGNRMGHFRQYLVIAGAFKDTDNVKMLIRSLESKGYKPFMAGVSSDGLHRVAFGAFSNFSQAEKQLRIFRKKENPAAWILVK